MQNDTAQLLATIESTVRGLIFRTENTYALKPFVWDVSTQGKFDISRLLKSTGNLVPIELDDFLSWQEYSEDFEQWEEFLEQNPDYLTQEEPSDYWMSLSERPEFIRYQAEEYDRFLSESVVMEQRYRSLLEILEPDTTALQVYRIVKYDDAIPCHDNDEDDDEDDEYFEDEDFPDDSEDNVAEDVMEDEIFDDKDYSNDRRSSKNVFESLKILVGKVSDDCWIGISPICSHVEFPNRPTLEYFLAQQIVNDRTEALRFKLKPILDSLTFIVRNCYISCESQNQYICEFAKTEDEVINRLLHLSKFTNMWEFEGMDLRSDGSCGFDKNGKFKEIDRVLNLHLKNLHFHIVGSISIFDIYAIGQTESGDWLGVSTTAIWTG